MENIEEISKALNLGVKDYFRKNSIKKAVIGLSGGLDSSVAACIIAKAISRENVLGILMPDRITSKESMDDAIELAKYLRIKHKIVPIDGFMENFNVVNKKNSIKNNDYALANAKARTRMSIIYYFANLNNAFVIGTSDKSEIALGYTTKFGDNASDIMVLGDLWKTNVRKLGKFFKIPKSILEKKPSAELIKGMTAEKELGADYKILDPIIKMHMEDGISKEQIIGKGFDKKLVEKTIRRIAVNEHKRRSAILIRISERSFHNKEWRMPITNRFEAK